MRDLISCAAFAWFLWAPLGRCLLSRIAGGRIPDSQSLCVAIGMGAWALAVLAIGLAGALYALVLLAAAGALYLSLKLHRYWKPANPGLPHFCKVLPEDRFLILVFAALSLAYGALIVASALAPELNSDALNVHLPYARDSAQSHRLAFDPNNWSSMMPALPLMSYITAFIFSGLSLAKLFNVLCYISCGGVVYFFARRWWGPLHGIVAAALFWSCPVALYEATTALIDLPLTLYSALAVFSLLEWTQREESCFLWLSAISLGLALGCKYHAFFWVPPFALVILCHSLMKRRCKPRELLPIALRFSFIVAALYLPWMLRTWHHTGNPVFPMANDIFKSVYWTPAMQSASLAAFANEGVGLSWQALARLPWTVTVHPGPFRGSLGICFLPGIIMALVRCKSLQVRYGIVVAAVHFYTWALVAQEIRYLLPLAPLLAVITSAGVLGDGSTRAANQPNAPAESRKSGLRRAGAILGSALLLVAAVISFPPLYQRWVKEWTYWHSYQSPFPYLLGKQSAQDYLRRDVPSIYVYDFINQSLTATDRILLLNDASRFYSRVPTLYSFTVEAEEILLQRTEEEVLRHLKQSRITHVLLNYNGIAPLPGVAPRLGVYFFLDRGFQERRLEAVCSRNNVWLYRVRTP